MVAALSPTEWGRWGLLGADSSWWCEVNLFYWKLDPSLVGGGPGDYQHIARLTMDLARCVNLSRRVDPESRVYRNRVLMLFPQARTIVEKYLYCYPLVDNVSESSPAWTRVTLNDRRVRGKGYW